MCSNAIGSGQPSRPESSRTQPARTQPARTQSTPTEAELAARLAAAIDELAAAASADQDLAARDLAERLVRAWSVITAADPELAARTARYARP